MTDFLLIPHYFYKSLFLLIFFTKFRLVLDQIQGNLAKSAFFSFFGNYVGQNRLVFAPCSLFFRIMNKKQVDYVVLGIYWMGKMD